MSKENGKGKRGYALVINLNRSQGKRGGKKRRNLFFLSKKKEKGGRPGDLPFTSSRPLPQANRGKEGEKKKKEPILSHSKERKA